VSLSHIFTGKERIIRAWKKAFTPIKRRVLTHKWDEISMQHEYLMNENTIYRNGKYGIKASACCSSMGLVFTHATIGTIITKVQALNKDITCYYRVVGMK